MRNKEQLTGFLLDHAAQRTVSFHMPGHKGSNLYRRFGYDGFLDQMMDCDITEIPGADNLFQPEGVLRNTMDRYRNLYGSRESYLLVNGSSCGLVAAVMASVPAGGRLILARNCHKAVYNALSLAGAQPVYAFPEMLPEYGITGEIRPEEIRRCIAAAPDASAVLIPSPNYYGICSDISSIAEIVHDAGMTLIVDQAHGAHLKFFDENGRVYVYFTIKAVKASMNCANDKACGLLKELERIGLIEKRKQGLCKPTIIYVKDFMGFRKAEHRDSDNQNFGIPKIRILDDRKSESNNTEKNNTELNNTNLILSGSDVDKDERSVYHDILMEQLSMEILYERYPIERETLDAILDMMLDIICSKKEYILIAGDNELYPLSRTQEILVAPFFRQL